MTSDRDWTGRVGDIWATEWRRTDRSFEGLAPVLNAAILAAAMMGADLAMGAMKKAMGAMLGKDPGAPPCIGAITIGMPTVLIGGFPMPSWSAIAKGLKKLIAALKRGRRGGVAQGKAFCLKCM